MAHLARRARGFTLIELLVVLAIVGTLLAIAMPQYFTSLDNARETSLRQNLAVMRRAIDQFHGDKGRYPESLQELVTARYLRSIPPDPITGAADQWVAESAPDPVAAAVAAAAGPAGVRDVRSGAPGSARDGTPYASW
jgi:general secretion pathway protein G